MNALGWKGLLTGLALAIAAGCESNSDVEHDATDDGVIRFALTPSAVHLGTNATQAVFRVVDGRGPYTWSVSDASLGGFAVAVTDDPVNTYTRKTATTDGVQTAKVQDRRTWRASASVVQDRR